MAYQCNRCNHWTADGQKHECINDDVEKLRAENKRLKREAAECQGVLNAKLHDKIARLREALKYYCDEILYDPELLIGNGERPEPGHWTKTARQALDEEGQDE